MFLFISVATVAFEMFNGRKLLAIFLLSIISVLWRGYQRGICSSFSMQNNWHNMLDTIRCLYLYFCLTLQANTMLITNASNLMKGVVGTLKAAQSASVKVYIRAYFSGTSMIGIFIMLNEPIRICCCSHSPLNLLLKKERVKISNISSISSQMPNWEFDFKQR